MIRRMISYFLSIRNKRNSAGVEGGFRLSTPAEGYWTINNNVTTYKFIPMTRCTNPHRVGKHKRDVWVDGV